MKLKINNGGNEVTYECSEPFEQFSGNGRNRWILAFSVKDNMTSDEVMTVFSPENTESLTFQTDDGTVVWNMTGYTQLNSAVIRRSSDGGTSVEIQTVKYVADTEDVANGEV